MKEINKLGVIIIKALLISTVLFVTIGTIDAGKRYEIITYRFDIPTI